MCKICAWWLCPQQREVLDSGSCLCGRSLQRNQIITCWVKTVYPRITFNTEIYNTVLQLLTEKPTAFMHDLQYYTSYVSCWSLCFNKVPVTDIWMSFCLKILSFDPFCVNLPVFHLEYSTREVCNFIFQIFFLNAVCFVCKGLKSSTKAEKCWTVIYCEFGCLVVFMSSCTHRGATSKLTSSLG